jgi:hypothetical protein
MTRDVKILIVASLLTVTALYATEPDTSTPRWVTATVQDREFCINRLNTLSDWVGFEAHFFPEGRDAKTLVMTGSDLCGPDFIKLLPKMAYDDIMSSGFDHARCIGSDGAEFAFAIDLASYR